MRIAATRRVRTTTSNRFTAASMAEVIGQARRGPAAPSADRHLEGGRVAGRREDAMRAGVEIAEIDDRGLQLRDLDTDRIARAGALERRDRDVRSGSLDLDRVEHIARFDAAVPGHLDEDVAAVDRGLELRRRDRPEVLLAR